MSDDKKGRENCEAITEWLHRHREGQIADLDTRTLDINLGMVLCRWRKEYKKKQYQFRLHESIAFLPVDYTVELETGYVLGFWGRIKRKLGFLSSSGNPSDAGVLRFAGRLLPRRIAEEELGDTQELVHRARQAGCGSLQLIRIITFGICSAYAHAAWYKLSAIWRRWSRTK